MSNTYIGIAQDVGDTFSNAKIDDLIFYASYPSRILIGAGRADNAQSIASKIQVSSSNIVFEDENIFNGNVIIKDNINIQGRAIVYEDLFVQGNLITRQDIVLSGIQVASGATYCNGDLSVINTSTYLPFSNATVFLDSLSGYPMISLHQTQQSSTKPFLIYQSPNASGYIVNSNDLYVQASKNMYFGNFGATNFMMTSNGNVGIGTVTPKAKLDVFNGYVNSLNVMKFKKSLSSSNDISININWRNAYSNTDICMLIESTQILNTTSKHGTRTQKHKLIMGPPPFNMISQVACGLGDMEAYTSMYVNKSNVNDSSTSVTIFSQILGFLAGQNQNNISHEFDINVLVAPQQLGGVWLD